MSVEILYVAHNRLDFTRESFTMLRDNTNWDLVDRLRVIDDRSRDGTAEFLQTALRTIPAPTRFATGRYGGPVAAMNQALDHTDSQILAKIDNDVIVCPGWLNQMLSVMDKNPSLDCLGMEPGFGGDIAPINAARSYEPAKWIGGVGLIRARVFKRRRPVQKDRFWGWTDFQRRYCQAGWITPALPVFLLDLLPLEPWMSLTDDYIRRGWQRPLHRKPGRYDESMRPFWSWWADTPDRVVTA